MADEDPKPENQPGDNPPSDIDKLRSEYDSKIADLTRAAEEAQSKHDALLKRIENGSQTAQSRAELEAEIAKVDKSDPVKAAEQLEAIALKYSDGLAATQVQVGNISGLYKQALAKAYAVEIAGEHGGDWKTYAKELADKSPTDAMMEQNAALLREKVGLEKARKANENNGNGNGQYRVDEGRGRPSQTSVLEDMRGIDVTTPEGQAEWQKREKELHAKVKVASGITD